MESSAHATRVSNRTGVAALLAVALMAAAPAALALTRIGYGRNYASANGGWVEACDMERDGNGVYLEGYLDDGNHIQIWDGNGSAGGCGNATFSSRVHRFRVCEDHSGCSSWINQ